MSKQAKLYILWIFLCFLVRLKDKLARRREKRLLLLYQQILSQRVKVRMAVVNLHICDFLQGL